MKKSALVVVDMQKGFFVPTEKLPAPLGTKELLRNNRRVVLRSREVGIPVIFVNDYFQKTEVPIDHHMNMKL